MEEVKEQFSQSREMGEIMAGKSLLTNCNPNLRTDI
jgi:hypothetical protein